jgi:hypothetical protein
MQFDQRWRSARASSSTTAELALQRAVAEALALDAEQDEAREAVEALAAAVVATARCRNSVTPRGYRHPEIGWIGTWLLVTVKGHSAQAQLSPETR